MPYVYKVHKIRDGRSYCTRIVNVTQAEGKGIAFTCTCSFKLAETSTLDVQADVDLWRKYRSVLRNKSPEEFDETPGMDVPWCDSLEHGAYMRYALMIPKHCRYLKVRGETGHNDIFPGLEFTKVNMEAYNQDRHPSDKRQLMFYRPLGYMPSDPNLQLCAHIYASDRNSLYIVANHLDIGDIYTQMSSLVHSTIFHSPTRDLNFGPSASTESPMDDKSNKGRWFCKEDWTNRAAGGRAMFYSNVWAPNGTHVATFMQDGLIRVTKKPEATQNELDMIRDRQAKWKAREKL